VHVTKKNPPMPVEELIRTGKAFHERNWIMGAAGNFSAVLSRRPFEWVITKSGVHKESLTSSDFVYLDRDGRSRDADRPPAAETPIHSAIISDAGAGAVLQTHSVWSTVLADTYSESGGIELEGFDVLKSLSPVKNGYPLEWVPILERSENYPALAETIARLLKRRPDTHAILLRKHGLYTWGSTVQEATRHIEVFELLFEVLVRKLHIFSQADASRASRPCS
jgi:methylthioribulose-1-phosphate dehydratase